MKFEKKILQSLAYDYPEEGVTDQQLEQFSVMEQELIDTSRWSHIYTMVFEFAGKYYESSYSIGATEQQDESAYEYDPDLIECREVKPVERTVIVYEKA